MDRPATLSVAEPRAGFRHEALFYADADEFLAGTTSFVRDGLEADQPTLVVLDAPKNDTLRAELSSDADRVFFADMAEVGRNPGRIIPAWREFVDGYSGTGVGLRGIGEPVSAERGSAELVECQRHESLLNLAFADTPGFYLLCPYDSGALAPAVLEEARRSHPFLTAGGRESESAEYRGLEEVSATFTDPLPDPPARREWRIFQRHTLAALRHWVAGHAVRAGLSPDTTEELVLAAHEVATNSVIHGGGGGICRVWTEGDTLVCEVDDKGLLESPLAGRERPAPGQSHGYGLWVANQLCDLVQVRTFAGGSAVRLHKHRA
jgi:anti-sigma regulatory factor (Ser/Thr protein kinase)